MKEKKAIITKHAAHRIHQRMGLPRRALEKMVSLALEQGVPHCDTKGKLNKFLSSVYLCERTANNMRVFKDKVFLFNDTVLITVLSIPSSIIKHLDRYIKEDVKNERGSRKISGTIGAEFGQVTSQPETDDTRTEDAVQGTAFEAEKFDCPGC